MEFKSKCYLCDSSGAEYVRTPEGIIWPSCASCLELGSKAQVERKAHGVEMNILSPGTFHLKPACSLIWLLSYYKTMTMTEH